MADDLHYVPGDFYRLDDRSGFKVRASKQKKEWTELIVHEDLWEVRHPQDFVKGVEDRQDVPEPRPRPSQDAFVGPLITQILFSVPSFLALEGGAPLLLEDGHTPLAVITFAMQVIPVVSTAGMSVSDKIQVMLNNNELFTTTISSIAAPYIGIASPLPFPASAGNIVMDLTASINVAPSRAELVTDLNG